MPSILPVTRLLSSVFDFHQAFALESTHTNEREIMGAVKEALFETIESAFESSSVEIHDEPVAVSEVMFDYFLGITSGDDEFLRSLESSTFENYGIHAADFITDWAGGFTAAYAVLSGLATTDDGCLDNYLAMLAYHYHHAPRHVGRALQRFGFTPAVSQGIVYLLAGRLLEASQKFRVVSFDYLKQNPRD
jgi:hypothetical protein